MPNFPKKLQQKLVEREHSKALRSLPFPTNLVDFSSNDYLGFAKNETIYADTFQYLLKTEITQNGATGSRLLTGNHKLYRELEELITEFHNVERALVFNSGYDANIGFFSAVPQRGDVVFYDEYIHASIRDGIKMGNARNYKFKHNDIEDLKSKIELSVRAESRTSDTDIYVVTESVFSMDGDSPDLKSLAKFCAKQNIHLIVDEAHAMGVLGKNGKGLVQDLKIEKQIFARIITFGKALGCHGAAILGEKSLIDYLVNFARSFIYTTGLPPHNVASILSAYRYWNAAIGEEEIQQLLRNIQHFKSKLLKLGLSSFFTPSDSAIQCCLISGNEKVKSISKKLYDKSFEIKAILSPTVPEGQERLRFCLHSYNSEEEIGLALQLLKRYL
ncbi:pyridoxal phosphate-dependent aminotransferase family protein [Maribacter algarum]|uniref:Pyridoxal phosphate-dependent aminotransferase family protein n=1 Tax=Maribacter algarum (ex Zhang et al. 2020) TaxID=2578118 RepID=A0A5S3PW99_9FLAO|nr:pyridoxal phosphate-dependent aminotransferase family protein [Maribacter algarum]TMM59281.1 pyridoxal phosphate-dependent aminotransferase family protein [Maribacter algarum]